MVKKYNKTNIKLPGDYFYNDPTQGKNLYRVTVDFEGKSPIFYFWEDINNPKTKDQVPNYGIFYEYEV